jgi:hypothetical protein
MFQYYAAPITRVGRAMYVNPVNGSCVLATSPHATQLCLGLPEPGSLFAVWVIGQATAPERPDLTLEQAGRLCAQIPPTRIYVCLDSDTIYPLAVDAAVEVCVEVGNAGAH